MMTRLIRIVLACTALSVGEAGAQGPLSATRVLSHKMAAINVKIVPVTPVAASGGTTPYVYKLTGTLPSGISFDAVTGQLSGTPTATQGLTTYIVTVTDAAKATAQNTFELEVGPADRIATFLSDKSITIRKTFDGTKEEQSPASIFYYRRPTGSDQEFSSTDIAIKVGEYEAFKNTPARSLLLYPTVEYHRNTDSTKLSHKISAAGTAEFRPVGLKLPPDPVTAGEVEQTGWAVAPVFILDAKYARDLVASKLDQTYSAQVFTTTKTYPALPGYPWRNGDGAYLGRYYAYIGAQHHSYKTEAQDTTGNVGFARVWTEFYPVTTLTERYLQLTADLAYRQRMSGNIGPTTVLSDLDLGANVYLDGSGHLGVGVEYLRGHDATRHFAYREQFTVGLKIKY
jgi:hypothetical protein